MSKWPYSLKLINFSTCFPKLTIPDGMVVYLEGMLSRIMLALLLRVFSKMEPLFHFKMHPLFFLCCDTL